MLAIKYKNLLTHKRVLATKKIKKKKIINRIKYKKYIYTYSIHNSYGVKGDVQKKKRELRKFHIFKIRSFTSTVWI